VPAVLLSLYDSAAACGGERTNWRDGSLTVVRFKLGRVRETNVASIFKRNKRRGEPYAIQYVDHLGKRRTVKGFTDKGLTEELAAKLEGEARLRTTGLIDDEQDRIAQCRQAPLEEHLASFETSLAANTAKHVSDTMQRIRAVAAGCDLKTLADIDAEKIEEFLRSLRTEQDLSPRSYNHYLQAFKSFCRWCVPKRMLSNPVSALKTLNAEVDVRHPRRALTPEEISHLIATTRASGKRAQNLPPELRARAYTLAYFTGLRKQELASLTANSFRLDQTPPTVTVAAACSKHRRKDVLPLHPELVSQLRAWLGELKPGQKLFPLLGRKKLSEMIRIDLKRAGIPYRTAEGIADFHAAGRHTYITQLLRSGASLPEAKELARHTDVKMTMRYTHIGINDQAKAVANLPSALANPGGKQAAKAALHGRCNLCGAGSHSPSPVGNGKAQAKRRNPRNIKGIDNRCRPLASVVRAEGMGLEPTTGFPALDFQSIR
jgi:site-specific recombinase XerD